MNGCCRAAAVSALAIAFSVAADPAAIIATSSNPALVPNENIAITGPDTNRIVTISPVSNGGGSATLRFLANGLPIWINTSSMTNSQNFAPYVDVGSDQVMFLNQTLSLSAAVIDDGLPNPPGRVTLLWSVVEGPLAPVITMPTAAATSVRFALEGRYTLRLSVTDGQFTSADDLTVTVLPPEQTGPEISEVTLLSITESNAVITWKTSRPADTQVQYGTTSSYGHSSGLDASLVTTHRVELTNLVANTWYHCRVLSSDSSGNLSVSHNFVLHTRAFPAERRFYLPLLVQEAELQPAMALLGPEFDFHQQYIASTISGQGSATLTFYVPEDGTYSLWCRVRALDSGQNAFCVAIDGVTNIYDVAEGKFSPYWQWDLLTGRTGTASLTRRLTLAAGLHYLTFAGLEPNTALSRLLLTNDRDFVPADGEAVGGTEDVALLTNAVMKMNINPGYAAIANPFHRGANTLGEVLPMVPNGTRLFKYDAVANGYTETTFIFNQWTEPDQTLAPGEGAFVFNPTDTVTDLVFMGSLRLENPMRILTRGIYLVSLPYPRTGKITEILDMPIRPGDILFKFNPQHGGYDYFEAGTENTPFVINAGESFFFSRF
jgi:hypothetical protein